MQFRGQRLEPFLAYWQSLSVGGTVPARKAFNPMHVPEILPWVTMVNRQEGLFAVTLTGTQVDAHLGWTKIASPLELIQAERADETAFVLAYLFETPSLYFVHARSDFGEAGLYDLDLLLAPFTTSEGLIYMAVSDYLDDPPMDVRLQARGYLGSDRAWFYGLPEPGYREDLPQDISAVFDQLGVPVRVQGDFLGVSAV